MAADDIIEYQFKPGQSGNPAGRPKNRAKAHCEKVLGKGMAKRYYGMTSEEIEYWDSILMTTSIDNLKKIAQDPDTPIYAKSYAIAILNNLKDGTTKTIDKLRANCFGTATRKVEIVGADGQPLIPAETILGCMSNEDLMMAREQAIKEEQEQQGNNEK